MIKGENIICISSIDWDFVWQGHQEIMSKFSANGNRVLFIENTGIRVPALKDLPRIKKRLVNWFTGLKGFRQEGENLFIYSPIILPFPYSRVARFINRRLLLKSLRRWMKAMEFYNPIIWTFLPTGTALDIINNIDNKLLIYYCIADFYELVDNMRKVKKTESELIRNSDLIFVQGKVLEEKCRALNDNVHVFPFGVNMEVFENFKNNVKDPPADIRNIKGPIIGYVGGVHKHIDFNLLRFIAQSHSEWSLVLVGPIQTDIDQIDSLANVHLLGKKEFSELPYYINEFDVCIIPYEKSEYTLTVYPTKLNEYHALGKPVVSTDLPEVAKFNATNEDLILLARTYKEFESDILKALLYPGDNLALKRIASAKNNNWIVRIQEMSILIEEALNVKLQGTIDWRRQFIKLYKTTREKILKAGLVLLSGYLLLFYTPFVWFLARPLKIEQFPQKANAVVVFAGGVGESGKAGQGYEERVEHAVQLYKQDYAKNLIFSSGQKHVFKESEVMKILAVSLGVPQDSIILEENARNTYENITFTKEILNKKGWNKILLVSSPYHMRRASLVYNKVAKGIKVIYTPVSNSFFYTPEFYHVGGRKAWKQININQINGILHEYLGILYYLWKGFI